MATFRSVSRNLPFVKQQLGGLTSNTSVFVKLICSTVFLCYFLSYSDFMVQVLSVTPELHFWEIIIDVVALFLCGKLIEPLWGYFEMFIFFGVVNTSVALLSAFFYLFLYMCTSNTELLFDVHIHGLAGYIASLAVAVKQMMPEHLVFRTPLGKITNRNIPLSMLLISIILYLVGLIEGTYPTMYTAGFLISWTYLRFYQRHSNGTRGDMAESFSFANFFPTVVQPPIAVMGNTVHGALVKIGLCQKPVRKYDLGAPSAITISLPGSDPHDMDRRREKALKALSERLNRVEPASSGHVPVPAWNRSYTPNVPPGPTSGPPTSALWTGAAKQHGAKSVSILVPETASSSSSVASGPSAATAAVIEALGPSSEKEPLLPQSPIAGP